MEINHITFVVKNLERSTSFFKDIFGAKEVYSSGDKTFSLSQEVFLTIDDLWVCIMKGEPSPKCGYNHIAFKIEEHEFDEYMERIENIGVGIKQGRSRVDGEGKSIYFYDFDNHLFELHTGTLADRLKRYEYDPKEQQ